MNINHTDNLYSGSIYVQGQNKPRVPHNLKQGDLVAWTNTGKAFSYIKEQVGDYFRGDEVVIGRGSMGIFIEDCADPNARFSEIYGSEDLRKSLYRFSVLFVNVIRPRLYFKTAMHHNSAINNHDGVPSAEDSRDDDGGGEWKIIVVGNLGEWIERLRCIERVK